MRRLLTTVPLLLFCAAPLIACGHRPEPPAPVVVTEVKVVRDRVPETYLRLRPEPTPPASGTQRDVAAYLIELVGALRSCRLTVEQIEAWSAAEAR